MQRGEGMAPMTDAQRDAAMRRWMESSNILLLGKRDSVANNNNNNNIHDKRTGLSDASSNVKSKRDNSGGPPNFGKGKFGGGFNGGGFGKGLKSNGAGGGNGGNSNGDKNKGNADDGNNNNGKDSSSNSNKGGGNSNNSNDNNDNGSKSNSNNNNNNSNNNSNNSGNNNNSDDGNGTGGGGAATTTAASGGGDDGSSDSNGAQQFSSDSIDTSTTSTDTPAGAAATTPTAVILTTSTIVTTGPDAIVTSFVPLITTAPASDNTTTPHRTFTGLGPFATNFPGFPEFPKPTGKDSSDDKKHKGTGSGNSTTMTDTKDDKNSNNNNNTNKGNNNNKNNSNNSKSSALSPTAERALISVGSIGAFIVICFIMWLVWRAFRKQKRKKMEQGSISTFPSDDRPLAGVSRLPARVYGWAVNKIPFLSRQRRAWQTLEETNTSNAGPMSNNNLAPSMISRAAPAVYEENGGDTLKTFGFNSDIPPTIPSQVYYSSGLGLQFQAQSQQFETSNVTRMPASLMRSNSNVSAYTHSPAGSVSSSQISAPSIMPAAVSYAGSRSTAGMGQPFASVVIAGNQQFIASDASSGTSTMRSRMPDPFYNQSQLARQPSDAYDPARRQVNRVSELSSLSSGFGDGEILMLASDQQKAQGSQMTTQGFVNLQQPSQPMPLSIPRPPPIPSGLPPSAGAGRFSWMRNKRMSRETVYTESSEDQPAKFRSVNSWVIQQTGRVRRGQASIDITTSAAAGANGVNSNGAAVMTGSEPGIPHPMPEEQRLTMMMDDEEEPRHPDTIPGIQIA